MKNAAVQRRVDEKAGGHDLVQERLHGRHYPLLLAMKQQAKKPDYGSAFLLSHEARCPVIEDDGIDADFLG